MSVQSAVKQILIRQQDRRYEKKLADKKISYDRWIREHEKNFPEAGESAEEFVIFRQREGMLAEKAAEHIGVRFAEHPELMILYGDEDLLQEERVSPWFKPDWSPDTYRACFYPGSVIAVRRCLLEQESRKEILFSDAEEIRPIMDALFQKAGGFERGCRAIGHMEEILFHGKTEEIRRSYLQTPEGAELKKAFLSGGTEEQPLVSVIIPSKDNPAVLEKCLSSLKDNGDPLEIIVVDNGSSAKNKEAAERLTAGDGMRYVYEPAEFNFSAMCNRGAQLARGGLLLFLNDDMEMQGEGWLSDMAERAMLPYVGAVGLKLYYPDSVRIQHDGIVNLSVGPVHKLQFLEDDREYYFGRNRLDCNCVAVTGACLMLEKKKFEEAGGFRDALRVAYNDVELGFRLLELGYYNVVLNQHFAYHHESLSRGNDEMPEKRRRLAAERTLLYRLHPDFYGKDPYYPWGLNREGLDSRIVPAYLTDRNVKQSPAWKPYGESLETIRRDDCLMARVETAGPERIQGYSVVLGDDNACYDKYLLLISENAGVFSMKTEPAYRQDLEENLPDQKNVALGGFCVDRSGEHLPCGNYRIAVLAVNRVSRLRLWNDTGKELAVEKDGGECEKT